LKTELLNCASEMFNIHPRDIIGPAKFGFLMPARFAVYKALHLRGWSYPRIAKFMGGRDHTTILHGVRRAEYMMGRDVLYADKVKTLSEMSFIEPLNLSEVS